MTNENDCKTNKAADTVTRLHAVPCILIVDDSPQTRCLYKGYFEHSGYDYQIIEAASVGHGLAVLRSQQVDCVLLDYCLPDADGLELLAALSTGTDSARVPVVMITSHGDEALAVDAMKLGAKDYLVKQRITADSLVAAVEYALDKARDEQEEHSYRKQLEHESVSDPLTGLRNRRYLFEQLGVELRRATRYRAPLSFLLVDLDHFKAINDLHGYITGDRVLRRFGQMLAEVARGTDVVARYGGEEFCIVLTNTDLAGGEQFAERVRAEARRIDHVDNDGNTFNVSCSIGLAQSHAGDVSPEALFVRSDSALYEAKHCGRDQVRVFAQNKAASA